MVNVIQKPNDTNTTIKKQGGRTTGPKNPGKSDRERKCLRCFQAWHPITECEAEKCATCASLHAVQHKDPRCPIFKYAVRYYIAHGELPKFKPSSHCLMYRKLFISYASPSPVNRSIKIPVAPVRVLLRLPMANKVLNAQHNQQNQ